MWPSRQTFKPLWSSRLARSFLLLLLVLSAVVLSLPYALPWLLQKQGIEFHWKNPQWHYNGFSVAQLHLSLPADDAEPHQLKMENVRIQWAWHAFPIRHLQAARVHIQWPINTNTSTAQEPSFTLSNAVLKWLPQHIELQQIDAKLAGLGHLQGALQIQASAQGKLWQPRFLHTQLRLNNLQGDWLNAIPTEFQPTQFNVQITTHPDHQDTANSQQRLTIDLHSQGAMRLQLNGLLELQQEPSWQGALNNAQLFIQLGALTHPNLQAQALQARLYFSGYADNQHFTLRLHEHSNLEAQQLHIPQIATANKITVPLAGLHLEGLSQTPHTLTIQAPLHAELEQLSAAQLHKQDWTFNGSISGSLPQLELTGNLTGEQGLALSSLLQLHNNSAQGHLKLTEIVFSGSDNPLQRTFSQWPEAMFLKSGRLSSQINFNLPQDAPAQLAFSTSANGLNGSIGNSQLKNLDVELGAQFDVQRAQDWQATLRDGQVLMQLEALTDPALKAQRLQADAHFSGQVTPTDLTLHLDKNTHLTAYNVQLADAAKAQHLVMQLPDLRLQGDISEIYTLEAHSPVNVHIEKLSADALHSQNWDFSGTLKGPLAQLSLSGDLRSEYGLSLNSQLRLLKSSVQGQATLKEIFFKAGNPLQKSFKDWPELVTLTSGRLRSQIDFSQSEQQPLQLTLKGDASGLSGIINRSELKNLSLDFSALLAGDSLSLDVPQLSIEQLDPGIPLGPIQLSRAHYRTAIHTPLQGIADWQHIEAQLLNGRIWLNAEQLDLSHKQKLLLHIEGLELQELFKVYPAEGLAGNGIIDGQLPLYLDHDSLYIEGGQLQARAPGQLQFQSPKIQALGDSNPAMRIVADALDDFHFEQLRSGLSYDESGKLLLNVRLEGQNPDIEKGRPIHLNINLEEDIPALLASIQLSGQVSEVIQQRVRERLEKR